MTAQAMELERHNTNACRNGDNTVLWAYICSNPVQTSGSRWASCSARGGGCDSS